MRQPKVDIKSLSSEERLALLEAVWDSLAQTPEAIRITDPQREELDRRIEDLEQDGAHGIPWDDVLARVRKRTG